MHDLLLFAKQHWELTLALELILVALVIIEFIRFKKGAQRISPTETIQLINHHNAIIVDIRSLEAFSSGHIIGAISLPLNELDNKYKKIEKFKSQPIVLVCAAGLESPRAATSLKKWGFNDVRILSNGIRNWKETGMPLVKD